MLGSCVTWSVSRWVIGGRVEQLHATHRNLYGIRGLDGHLYWQWLCDFKVGAGGDLFAPLQLTHDSKCAIRESHNKEIRT